MLKELERLDREQLLIKYKQVLKQQPPPQARKSFLKQKIAWQMQADKYGGHSKKTLKQLDRLATKLKNKSKIKESDITAMQSNDIKAGTKLLREFKGIKHEVTALGKSFEYKGKQYKSLSAIANKITGTRWNGKVFFGLK